MWLVTLKVGNKVSNKRLLDKFRCIAIPYSREGEELKLISHFPDYDSFEDKVIKLEELVRVKIQIEGDIDDLKFDILKSTWDHILEEMKNATLRKDLFKLEG